MSLFAAFDALPEPLFGFGWRSFHRVAGQPVAPARCDTPTVTPIARAVRMAVSKKIPYRHSGSNVLICDPSRGPLAHHPTPFRSKRSPRMFDPQRPPELTVSGWFNTPEPRPLAALKGKVVVLTAFQTHCPGSLKHGLPQAVRLARGFSEDEVAVIGLNTAFEEHASQSAEALEAFIAARDLPFAVAKDMQATQESQGELPQTMRAYEIQGTPTLLIFDRQGRLRRHYLGQVDDMRLAAEVMAFCMEAPNAPVEQSMAVERRLAAALAEPEEHGGCGCGHAHHDHEHDHGGHDSHAHHDHGQQGCCGGEGKNGGGCCGGGSCG